MLAPTGAMASHIAASALPWRRGTPVDSALDCDVDDVVVWVPPDVALLGVFDPQMTRRGRTAMETSRHVTRTPINLRDRKRARRNAADGKGAQRVEPQRTADRRHSEVAKQLLRDVYAAVDLAHARRRLVVFFQFGADADVPELRPPGRLSRWARTSWTPHGSDPRELATPDAVGGVRRQQNSALPRRREPSGDHAHDPSASCG